jgi:hypothetical protein
VCADSLRKRSGHGYNPMGAAQDASTRSSPQRERNNFLGSPRCPKGPRRAAGALPNLSFLPSAAPGHGERLAAWGTTRYARWRELVVGLVIMVALMAPIVGWYRTPASWAIAACTIGPGWLLGGLRLPSPLDWGGRGLAAGALHPLRRLGADQPAGQAGPGDRLDQPLAGDGDRDGRKLRVHLAGLRGDRRVFEAFLSGVRHARSTGLTLSKATRWSSGATLDC